jgi:tRNA-Thr(GGU) m(6)t(6)A37 methyltransferase TsaA
MDKPEFAVTPIGYVRAQEGGFRLEIEKRYLAGLKELDGFSHINVLWWCHLCDSKEYRRSLQCDRPYRQAPAMVGVFATRSPVRPNPVAVSAVAISKIDPQAGVIHVPFIDAEDGTPIIDIKPYHPCADRIRDCTVPKWCRHWPQWYEDSAMFDWSVEFVNAR